MMKNNGDLLDHPECDKMIDRVRVKGWVHVTFGRVDALNRSLFFIFFIEYCSW